MWNNPMSTGLDIRAVGLSNLSNSKYLIHLAFNIVRSTGKDSK